MDCYFTSDLHLNSFCINKYAKRPFLGAEQAAAELVKNINSRCKRNDLLVHAGDFMLKSADRHGEVEDIPLNVSLEAYLDQINCRVFLLDGNHDSSHAFKSDAKSLVLDLSPSCRNVYVSHFPSDHPSYCGPKHTAFNNSRPRIVLCGHVHQAWLFKYDFAKNIINYNVGVDQHGYFPVKSTEIVEDLENLKRFAFFPRTWTMTRDDFMEALKKHMHEAREAKARNKKEKHAKRGLTPEECERRKLEAMKRKGLI